MSPEGDFETVIGVEVHVQLRTRTKMFCGCRVEFGADPNTRVCPVCLGLPGALPVANCAALALGVRAALALGCQVEDRSAWARKHYFYPDLPKGYQITQHRRPLARRGEVVIRDREGQERSVRIERLHLEEDAGKSLHDRVPGATAVDLNRCGIPLAEIVTDPCLRSPGETRRFLVRLQQILEHYAGVSDCNMEEGSLRVDANLSVRRRERPEMGTKTEVKNLNSFSQVERALIHERDRQMAILRDGGTVDRETRLWDPARGETRPLRGKEEALDYRYFPEPDLPPLTPGEDMRAREGDRIPELPHRVEAGLVDDVGLPEQDAVFLAAYPRRWRYFERVLEMTGIEAAKDVANLLMGAVAEELNRREGAETEGDLLPPRALARIVELRREGTLSSSTADRTVELVASGEASPDVDRTVREFDLTQVRDEDRLRGWVRAAVDAHPEEARRYASGETRLLSFFMGQVMERAGGSADPEMARDLLQEELESPAREDGEDDEEPAD